MYRFDGDLSRLAFLRYDITNLAYSIRHEGRAAVIGVGGGRDLLSAQLFGFRDVTGVELNPIFIDMLTGVLADYNRLATRPGVRLLVDEARSWFSRSVERFDLMQMSMIDTWAATGGHSHSPRMPSTRLKDGAPSLII
jgi:predicted membrane-bound spermidine synthase